MGKKAWGMLRGGLGRLGYVHRLVLYKLGLSGEAWEAWGCWGGLRNAWGMLQGGLRRLGGAWGMLWNAWGTWGDLGWLGECSGVLGCIEGDWGPT